MDRSDMGAGRTLFKRRGIACLTGPGSGSNNHSGVGGHAPELWPAGTAGAAALALFRQRGKVEPGGEVGADFVLRDVEAVADDAPARGARSGRGSQRGAGEALALDQRALGYAAPGNSE
jgi:hypothetical protein